MPARQRSYVRTARALAPLAVVATLLCATPAHAQTRLLSRRVGGLGLIGPSIAHPASIHYNPATLGLLPGALRLYLDGTLDFDLAGYEPALVNSQTGVPIAGQRGDTVSNIGLGPRFFFAATSDLANEAVHIAGAIYSPVAQSFSRLAGGDGDFFDGAAQAPGRAHVVELSAYQINFTISASLRVIERWWIGATFTFAYSRMRYAFVRDAALRGGRTREGDEPIAIDDCGSGTPCGYDADAARGAPRGARPPRRGEPPGPRGLRHPRSGQRGLHPRWRSRSAPQPVGHPKRQEEGQGR